MSSGSVSTSRPSPPGNSREKVSRTQRDTSAYASVKTCSTRASTSRTIVEQVLAGRLEVLELFGEELVPLLERGELLERQRVDLAEHGQRSLGLRRRLLCSSRSYGRGLGRPSRPRRTHRFRLNGTSFVGAVLGDQGVLVETELLEGALGRLPRCCLLLLGAHHLVAVHGVDQLSCSRGRSRIVGPDLRAPAHAGRGTPRPRLAPRRRAGIEGLELWRARRPRPPPTAWAAPASRISAAPLRWHGPRFALGLGRAQQRIGPSVEGAGTLLARCAATRRASISACRAERASLDQSARAPRRPASRCGESVASWAASPGAARASRARRGRASRGLLGRRSIALRDPVGLGPAPHAPAKPWWPAPRRRPRGSRRTRAAWRARRPTRR